MCILILLSVILMRMEILQAVSLIKTSTPPQRNNHQNISNLLDNLLRGYDNSVRPDFGGKFHLYLCLQKMLSS